MRVATIFAYLIGRRRAILDIAADRKALVVAAMLVLAAALARNYDRASLMDEPWRLLGPFAASLAISGPLFLIISRGVSERSHPAVCPRAKEFSLVVTSQYRYPGEKWMAGLTQRAFS